MYCLREFSFSGQQLLIQKNNVQLSVLSFSIIFSPQLFSPIISDFVLLIKNLSLKFEFSTNLRKKMTPYWLCGIDILKNFTLHQRICGPIKTNGRVLGHTSQQSPSVNNLKIVSHFFNGDRLFNVSSKWWFGNCIFKLLY